MNATTIVRAPSAVHPPELRGAERAALDAKLRGTLQRLPVWEERARKMGFPPSAHPALCRPGS